MGLRLARYLGISSVFIAGVLSLMGCDGAFYVKPKTSRDYYEEQQMEDGLAEMRHLAEEMAEGGCDSGVDD